MPKPQWRNQIETEGKNRGISLFTNTYEKGDMNSKSADIAIKGGILVNSKGMTRADVFVKDGLIEGIELGESERPASRFIDANGTFVLPGVIDAHLLCPMPPNRHRGSGAF